MVCVWKLKGLRPPPPPDRGGPVLPSLRAGEFIEEFMDPKRALPGKVSVIGDKAFGSNVIVESTVCGAPSIPRDASSSPGMGVGGVGVRGGAGIGRLEAIALSRDFKVS